MISIQEHDNFLEGKDGAYYRLANNVGVKLIHSKVFSTVGKACRSKAFRTAIEESEIIALAQETGVAPVSYGITLVSVRGGFKVGVLMQHLGQMRLADSEFYDFHEVYDYLNETLKEVGIHHGDLNEDNIMVYRGKFYAVDFSPESVTLK